MKTMLKRAPVLGGLILATGFIACSEAPETAPPAPEPQTAQATPSPTPEPETAPAPPAGLPGGAAKKAGIESQDYVWNEAIGEKVAALELEGNVENGEEAYEVCSACHLPNGSGRPDGTFPQLAGQHTTVLIKQIADIREGLRDNPIMYPFATTLTDPRELADVAAYIETLPIPTDNGQGPGVDLERGGSLYEQDCVKCHGPNGEGSAKDFYPVLAGQHYEYLLRQIGDINAGRRRNANPDMVEVVKSYSDEDLAAVVDYMSRLRWPEREG